MANNRYNKQIQTVSEKPSGGQGVKPLKGSPQPSSLNMSLPTWGGLPGKSGPDRSAGVTKKTGYAQNKGL